MEKLFAVILLTFILSKNLDWSVSCPSIIKYKTLKDKQFINEMKNIQVNKEYLRKIYRTYNS